jgi:hypothetical protein
MFLFLVEFSVDLFGQVNPFISLYRTARDQLLAANENGQQFVLNPQIQLIAGSDCHRENLPIVAEVAAVIPDNSQ